MSAQSILCDYEPINFEDTDFVWSLATRDTSAIGFMVQGQTYLGENEHLTGNLMNRWHDKYLYSITSIDMWIDRAGALLEKIDPSTGELVWSRSFDLRLNDYRENMIDILFDADKIYMYGGKSYHLNPNPLSFDFSRAMDDLHFFERVLSIEDGSTIDYMDNTADTSFFFRQVGFNTYSAPLSRIRDSIIYNIDVKTDSAVYLVVKRFTDKGQLITESDTVFASPNNPVANYQLNRFNAKIKKIEQDDQGNFYYVDQFITNNDSIGNRAAIYKFDSDMQPIDTLILTPKLFSGTDQNLEGLLLDIAEKDRISIIERYGGKVACHVLDYDLNYLRSIDVSRGNDFYFFNKMFYLSAQDKVILFDRSLVTDGLSSIYVYVENDQGGMDMVKELKIDIENKVAFVEDFIEYEDDLLIKITHSCYIDLYKHSWHPTWIRFTKEALNLDAVSNDNIPPRVASLDLYPNPTTRYLYFRDTDNLPAAVQVIDVQGQSHTHYVDQQRIDVGNLVPGIYTVLDPETGASSRFVKVQ